MTSWLSSWRLALRLARRDLLRNRARAIIALVMVTLPVLGVVAADVLIQTAKVSPAEGVTRVLGTEATAKIRIADDHTGVIQGANPDRGIGTTGTTLARPTTLDDIEHVIGHRAMLPAVVQTEAIVRTPHGREPVRADQVDMTAPLAHGLYRLSSGRWPRTPDEVVVNQAVRDRGVGATLDMVTRDRSETARRIVGTVVDATSRTNPVAVGLPGAFPPETSSYGAETSQQAWYVDGAAITWAQVKALNALGVLVSDRHILSHPGDYPDPFASSGVDDTTVQVGALIVVMALIEVVLLAGPSFAVGARKQQRTLALLASSGGTPAQARRVIIAGGLLLGVTAAVIGVIAGIGVGRLWEPVVQRFNGDWFGPFEVVWWHVAAVAAFGVVSALIACLVPAWIASRHNVVAVLAGRRGDAKPARAFPWLGLALFGVGVLMAILGARGSGALTVAWSAVICVLGMVLLVPVVVAWAARAAGRFPLPIRFAARDAVRHRTRTTPAVAAVAATVAGVVALGIATASNAEQNRETYQPSLVIGNAAVTPSPDFEADRASATDWDAIASVVRQHLPGVHATKVVGPQVSLADGSYADIRLSVAGDDDVTPAGTESGFGTDVVVSDGSDLPPTIRAGIPAGAGVTKVRKALAGGAVVAFTGDRGDAAATSVSVRLQTTDDNGDSQPGAAVSAPAHLVYVPGIAPVRAILPPAVAQRLGLPVTTLGLELDRPHLSPAAAKDLDAALDDVATPASVYVERGYQADPFDRALQWILALLAAVLMLGGTLTAMFLALADARPDLATLAAVGAEPRTSRTVAAAYTFVVAFVGAVLGMAVGFVPGLAIARPLTRIYGTDRTAYFLDVPWVMIAVVVVGLPILTAVIVGACVRSRLPMVSRLI